MERVECGVSEGLRNLLVSGFCAAKVFERASPQIGRWKQLPKL